MLFNNDTRANRVPQSSRRSPLLVSRELLAGVLVRPPISTMTWRHGIHELPSPKWQHHRNKCRLGQHGQWETGGVECRHGYGVVGLTEGGAARHSCRRHGTSDLDSSYPLQGLRWSMDSPPPAQRHLWAVRSLQSCLELANLAPIALLPAATERIIVATRAVAQAHASVSPKQPHCYP
jgi:hypothetical protein